MFFDVVVSLLFSVKDSCTSLKYERENGGVTQPVTLARDVGIMGLIPVVIIHTGEPRPEMLYFCDDCVEDESQLFADFLIIGSKLPVFLLINIMK